MLVKLASSSSRQTIPWNTNNGIPLLSSTVLAIGFGTTAFDGNGDGIVGNDLLKVDLTVQPLTTCDGLVDNVCVSAVDKGICYGDSGR
jgi:hypothetical protein